MSKRKKIIITVIIIALLVISITAAIVIKNYLSEDSVVETKKEMTVEMFNAQFIDYSGIQEASDVKNLMNAVTDSNNEQTKHKITVKKDGVSSKPRDIKADINSKKTYIVTLDYDDKEYICKINVIEVIETNIQGTKDCQISVDAINWKSTIRENEIIGDLINTTYETNMNHLSTTMDPVSTAAHIDTMKGYMKMFLGTVEANDEGEYILCAEAIPEDRNTETYIAFDLFFKTNEDRILSLDTKSGVFDNGVDSKADKGMENAARIGFVYQGHIEYDELLPPKTLAIAAQNLICTDSSNGENVTIWEPNYDGHTDFTKLEVFNLFGILTNDPIWSNPIIYDGICSEIDKTDIVLLTENDAKSNPGYFKAIPESRFVRTTKVRNEPEPLNIELKAGITKIRIYMWLEGQDLDCNDTASGSDIKWDLILTSTK